MSQDTEPDLAEKISKDQSFTVLEGHITERTLKGILDMKFETMTDIQAKCIPHIMKGRNIFGSAKTGSGKTLAFLIPVVDLIHQIGFKTRNGTGAIIISPTRELALQTFDVLKVLTKYHNHTINLAVGGNDRRVEAEKLVNGVNILVSTPGRLLDHLKNTPYFLYTNLEVLVIDEADRIMQNGFEEEMKQINELLPKTKQTLLFSATRTNQTEEFAKPFYSTKPVYIKVGDDEEVTVEGLAQGYCICPPEKRFIALFSFLGAKAGSSKVMVFMNARVTVRYFENVIHHWGIPTLSIHGGHKQGMRARILRKFKKEKSGVLICTDVAARGLDIPDVDWVVQFDPPRSIEEYIHRVGRTARGHGAKGSAMIFLLESEVGFVKKLRKSKIPIDEYDLAWDKTADLKLEEIISNNHLVREWAIDAYEGYIKAYSGHPLKEIFNIKDLDLNKVAFSFGLNKARHININRRKRRRSDSEEDGYRKKRKFNVNHKGSNKNFS